MIFAPATQAGPASDSLDTAQANDRLHATAKAREAATLNELAKAVSTRKLAALESESISARNELAALQKELLSVLTKDDVMAMKTIRARLSAQQTALEAVEDEKALISKEAEEAERERDTWKKRIATLELALRMDLKVMLASPADIEEREKKVDAARKDIDSAMGQIIKYSSRKANAITELAALRKRLRELSAPSSTPIPADLKHALEDESGSIRRLIVQQEQWFRLNHMLEMRSRRNLAFARTDYLVYRRYADALARKADVRRADAAQASAEQAESCLSIVKNTLAPLQQRIATEQSTIAQQTEIALKTIGEARTAQAQEQAQAAYTAAQVRKARWDAENDCWKEFIALQKAGAAFARELSDRARNLAENRSIAEINREERMLRESLATSEQYVRSFQSMIQKADDAIESARRELGLSPETVQALNLPLNELFRAYNAIQPPTPDLFSDQLQALFKRLPEGVSTNLTAIERRHEIGTTLIVRMAQREMLKARKSISERWLANSREAIKTLERLAGATLWQEHDPRLNGITCQELGSLLMAMGSDALYAWDCRRLHLGHVPGVPSGKRLIQALGFILLLWLTAWIATRQIPSSKGFFRLSKRLIILLTPIIGTSLLLLRMGTENMALQGTGFLLLSLSGWVVIRHLMLNLTSDHRPPAGATLGGGLFTAINSSALWTSLLYPFYRIASACENPWDIQAVIHRLWLFGIALAIFRLLLHPSLMGRLLSRRSEHRGLRWLGTVAAIACVLAAALAALPYLAALNNLGQTVLVTVELSFVILVAALIASAVTRWIINRNSQRMAFAGAWIRSIQTVIFLLGGIGMAWIWGQFLNRVILAPNAPLPIQELVRTVSAAAHSTLRIWHRELTAGMTVSSLVRGILVFVLSFWVSRVVKRLFLERVLSRTPMDEATRLTFAAILGYAVILLGFLVGLNVAGSSLQNLALLAGAITVGLGFGLQNVINNFVSSLLIHFGRTIRVGDYIDVAGTRGTVREIGLRNTVISTDDGITVLVPNGSFITANIINWTNPSRRTRLHIPLIVTRQADLSNVTEIATAIARNHPLIVKDPPPIVEVRSVTAAQVNVELLLWTDKPEKLTSITGELNLSLDRPLRDKGFLL